MKIIKRGNKVQVQTGNTENNKNMRQFVLNYNKNAKPVLV